MRRREFITLVVGAAAQWSRAARAEVLPIIGFVSSRSSADSRYAVSAFRKGLTESGFTEGQNLKIEFRWAEGKYGRLPALVNDLIAQGINVLVAVGGEPSAFAAKAATSTIPIVFTTGGDPVKAGLVTSLNRPGGNATGISLLTTAPESKRLGLLHEIVPKAALIGVLINPNYAEAENQTRECRMPHIALVREFESLKQAPTRNWSPLLQRSSNNELKRFLFAPIHFSIPDVTGS
jgi:ABC-type uncharacterized transport system substrate-binding protein